MQTELEKREILRLSNEESNKITRECLRIAMIKLMDKKDFEKISITAEPVYRAEGVGQRRALPYRSESLVYDIFQNDSGKQRILSNLSECASAIRGSVRFGIRISSKHPIGAIREFGKGRGVPSRPDGLVQRRDAGKPRGDGRDLRKADLQRF